MDLSTIQKKVYRSTKANKLKKKLTKLIAAKTTASRKLDEDNLKEKWIYNLSSKLLTSEEKSPL